MYHTLCIGTQSYPKEPKRFFLENIGFDSGFGFENIYLKVSVRFWFQNVFKSYGSETGLFRYGSNPRSRVAQSAGISKSRQNSQSKKYNRIGRIPSSAPQIAPRGVGAFRVRSHPGLAQSVGSDRRRNKKKTLRDSINVRRSLIVIFYYFFSSYY